MVGKNISNSAAESKSLFPIFLHRSQNLHFNELLSAIWNELHRLFFPDSKHFAPMPVLVSLSLPSWEKPRFLQYFWDGSHRLDHPRKGLLLLTRDRWNNSIIYRTSPKGRCIEIRYQTFSSFPDFRYHWWYQRRLNTSFHFEEPLLLCL